ncbi:putative ribonuclease H-like domain-containing protein [Tanacetum coccineum]
MNHFAAVKNAFSLPHVPNVFSIDDTGIFGNDYDDEDVGAEAGLNNLEITMNVSPIPITRIDKDHPKDQIIRDLNSAIQTRRMTKISDEHAMEPKKVIQALEDPSWIEAMQEELIQFELQNVWTLVDLPNGKSAIRTKWIEAIRLFLAYASFIGFIVYQMDVKSAFLYGTIKEEVYVCQPPGFEHPYFPDKVYKVEKALYGLHQAPKAWYETLSTYLNENRFRRGSIDKTLFIKKDKGDILLVQVYVDDIIFGSTKKSLCDEFKGLMHKRFQMSSIGELTFFLGLQAEQTENRIFISQDKYVAEILKKFDFAIVKTASTSIKTNKALVKDEEVEAVDVHLYRSMIGSLMYLTAFRHDITFAVCACVRFQVTPKTSHIHAVKRIFRYFKGQHKLGLWYPRDSSFNLEAFSNSDYAGASLDRKSTTGGCQFLGKRLISWQCKKQTIVANSTTKAEYVVAANCCGQVLWIQNQMLDYGFNFMNTKIYIDNESTICIVKNLVFHSKTKHIEIRHHFIKDSYEKKLIQVIKIHIDHNVVDLLTKAFDVSRLDERECIIKQKWVKDETIYKEWEDRRERASTTASSLEAEQDSVNTLRSGKDIIKLMELMEHCITLSELFWATTKVKTVNGERQLQALVDKKKVIITETSIRSDLNLEDAGGTDCLPTNTIFEELARMGYEKPSPKLTFFKAFFSPQWKFLIHTITQCLSAKTTAWNEFSSTMAFAIICLATNQKFNLSKYIFDVMLGDMLHHKKTYVNPSHTKKIFANMKREGKDFSGRIKPLFATIMVSDNQEKGVDSDIPTDSQQTPITTQPSTSKPQKKQSRRKQRKDIEVPQSSASTEPMTEKETNEEFVPKHSYDPSQSDSRVESSNGAQEDASKQGRKIADLDADAEVTLVDETQEIHDDNLMFDTGVLEEQEKDIAKKEVSVADLVTTTGEVVTTANVEVTTVNAPTTTIDELTLTQTLIEIKVAKPKAITSSPTTTTTTRPKARGL